MEVKLFAFNIIVFYVQCDHNPANDPFFDSGSLHRIIKTDGIINLLSFYCVFNFTDK